MTTMAQQRRTSQRRTRKPPQNLGEAVKVMEELADASEAGTLSKLYYDDNLEENSLLNPIEVDPQPIRFNERSGKVEINPTDAAVMFGMTLGGMFASWICRR